MIVGIYKPKNWTSHDVIAKLRSITKIKRIGHAGTLDPLAEGVLVVGIGRESTKSLNIELQKEKEYGALIKLGEISETGDEEGGKTEVDVQKFPTKEEVEGVLKQFVGEIEQKPHKYSAVKIGGRSAYKFARRGQSLELSSRKVLIKKIELLKYDYPFVQLAVTTGPGVYIRVLAEDLGEKLGTGGYLFKLTRTRVGEFTLEKTKTIEEFARNFEEA